MEPSLFKDALPAPINDSSFHHYNQTNLNLDDFDFDFDSDNNSENDTFEDFFKDNINKPNDYLIPEFNTAHLANLPQDFSTNKKINSVIFHNFFSKEFICNNINLSDKISKRDLLKYESSDKIILPVSSLNILASYSKDNLYVLRIMNPKNSKYAFVGIGDFSAPERIMFVPSWLMEYICARSGDKIYVDAISVPQVSYAKIKMPSELNMILSTVDKTITSALNIKAILEFVLRNHCLLFLGKKIQARIFDKVWEFEVVALKPVNIGCIVNTDVHLDFA